MEMNHYKDKDGNLYGFAADGSQNHLIDKRKHKLITKQEADQLGQASFKPIMIGNEDYYRQRIMNYPEIGEFLDAWVKKDEVALEEYRKKCLAVKAQFPKPEGF